MAYLWSWTDSGWWPQALTGRLAALAPGAAPASLAEAAELPHGSVALLHAALDGTTSTWLLVDPAGARVRINGRLLATAVRALADHDEILLPGGRPFFFTTERRPERSTFPGSGRPSFCPRCRQAMEAGTPAVACPGCGMWHHETHEHNCWTYGESCAMCAQSTSFDSDFCWTPEDAGA